MGWETVSFFTILTQINIAKRFFKRKNQSYINVLMLSKRKKYFKNMWQLKVQFSLFSSPVFKYILKHILLIMLLQLSQFFSLWPLPPGSPSLQQSPCLSSCPWFMHVSSLVSSLFILFLTSPCLFCTYPIILLNPYTFPPILLPLSKSK